MSAILTPGLLPMTDADQEDIATRDFTVEAAIVRRIVLLAEAHVGQLATVGEFPGSTLSFLPVLTASLTMLMRDGLTILPAWQIALSACIQVASAVGAIWLGGRAFRLGMLRYGQRLRWREIFARSRSAIRQTH